MSRDMTQKIDLSLSIVLQHFWTYWDRKNTIKSSCTFAIIFFNPRRCWLRVISTVKSVFLLLRLCISSWDCQKKLYAFPCEFSCAPLKPIWYEIARQTDLDMAWKLQKRARSMISTCTSSMCFSGPIGLFEDRVNSTEYRLECRHLPSLTFNRPHFSVSKYEHFFKIGKTLLPCQLTHWCKTTRTIDWNWLLCT